MALFLVDQGIKMIEKEITKFEKEILLQGKISQLENELKEFSDLQKKKCIANAFKKHCGFRK